MTAEVQVIQSQLEEACACHDSLSLTIDEGNKSNQLGNWQ